MQKHDPQGHSTPPKRGSETKYPLFGLCFRETEIPAPPLHRAKGRNWLKVLYFRPTFGGCGMPLGGRAFACKLHLDYTFIITNKKRCTSLLKKS